MAGKLRSNKTGLQLGNRLLRMLGFLSILLLGAVSNLFAGSLDSTVIGMFPKDASDLGYADLSQARQLAWYPQFEAQLVPVELFGFEQFLAAAQIRQTSPIGQVAWATIAAMSAKPEQTTSGHPAPERGQLVAVAIGDFDVDNIKSFLGSKKINSIEAGNYTLYAAGTGTGSSNVFFSLLDSQTIAFGPLEPLKRVLKVRDGEEDSVLLNQSMMTLIETANGDSVFWGVMNSTAAARTIERLVPEAAKFPQSRDLLGKLKEVLVTVKVSDDIELELQASSSSPSDALLISQLLQAGVLMKRYETNSDDNPEMAKLLDALHVRANGTQLDISLNLTNDQVISLIEHNTFSMEM